MGETRCKWQSGDFDIICVNDKCPMCSDYCPVADTPNVCKWEDREENKEGPKVSE